MLGMSECPLTALSVVTGDACLVTLERNGMASGSSV